MGKMSVMLILLSAITWMPQLLLFLLQSYLEGFAWFRANLWIASAIIHRRRLFGYCCSRCLSQTISALVKWRVVASGAMLGMFLFRQCLASSSIWSFKRTGETSSASVALMKNVTAGLFGTFDRVWRKNSGH